jgi:hypothetical protein
VWIYEEAWKRRNGEEKKIGRKNFLKQEQIGGYVRGVLGNKCAGQHNLKTVQIREIMLK